MMIDHLHGLILQVGPSSTRVITLMTWLSNPKIIHTIFQGKSLNNSIDLHQVNQVWSSLRNGWFHDPWSLKFSFCWFFAPGNCTGNHDNCPSSWASRKIGVIRYSHCSSHKPKLLFTSKTSKVSRLRPHRIYFVNRSRSWLIDILIFLDIQVQMSWNLGVWSA